VEESKRIEKQDSFGKKIGIIENGEIMVEQKAVQKEKAKEAKIEEKKENGLKDIKDKGKELKKEEKEKPQKKEQKKFIPYEKKENKKKSKEAIELQKKLAERKWHPVFRGRFGKKNIRRKSIEKWDKWRKPHGIDLDKGLQHGFRPKIGYGNKAELKHLHPSGYREVAVCNMNDLEKIDSKTHAARISRTIGKRKRNEIVKKANEKGVWVLN